MDEPELLTVWRTIWFHPRQTIRRIVDAPVPPSWIPVVALGAVGVLLNVVNEWLALPSPPRMGLAQWFLIVLLTLLFWVLGGPLVLALYGRRRGGVGNPRQLRHALAWSYAPIAVSSLCWIPLWVLTAGAAYTAEFALEGRSPFLVLPLFLAISVADIWSLVIVVAAVAEVQRWSLWRAFDSLFLLLLVTLVVSVAIYAAVLRFTMMLSTPAA